MYKIISLPFLLLALMAHGGETEREADIYTSLAGHFAASHILIQYRRAEKASEDVTRSKKEAQEKAESLLAQLQTNPERFEALARAESDGPSAVKGGFLGGFQRGDMASKFEAMVKKLSEGELAPSVVKTGFGYHIIRRESMRQRNYSIAAVIIAHEGANQLRSLREKPEVYQRSKKEAEAIIAKAKAALANQKFAAVAKEYGDLNREDGFFGVFRKGDGPLSDQLVDVVRDLDTNANSGIVSLPIGMAILQRRAVVRYRAERIWIGHRQSQNLRKKPKRNRDEAETLAREVFSQLEKAPDQFAALAKKHSAGPFATRGGKMAPWFQGLQPASFEAIVAGLEVDAMTAQPVETEDGFFIIKRTY